MSANGSSGAAPRVLVAETDSMDRLALLKSLTERGGCVARGTASTVEALRELKDTPYDAVIADLDFDGGRLITALEGVFRELPVIIVTDRDDGGAASRFIKKGVCEYVVKDVERRYLLGLPHTIQQAILQMKMDRALRETMREIERSNQALEQFAATASHDLQSPLSNIEMAGELLGPLLEPMGEKAQHLLTLIQRSARKMRALVQNILKLSHVGTRVPALEDVDLGEVLGEVLGDLEAQVRQSGARVHAGALITLQANRTLAYELLLNLVGNALKYSRPDAAVEVAIAGEAVSDPEVDGLGQAYAITVRDNGIGFAPELARRLFEPFFRVHEKHCEGTGIGLAICQRIAEAHGGRIWAEGRPGEGAAFHVVLPLRQRREVKSSVA